MAAPWRLLRLALACAGPDGTVLVFSPTGRASAGPDRPGMNDRLPVSAGVVAALRRHAFIAPSPALGDYASVATYRPTAAARRWMGWPPAGQTALPLLPSLKET